MKNYIGKDIPKLGFGLMRLPEKNGEIDIGQTCQMADLFMARGFTYFDTAYGYNNGKSEEAAKIAVVDRYPRESFQLASKLPAWLAKTADEAKQMFWTSLKRSGVDYFDFFLLHNIGDKRTASFDEFGIWDFLAEQKEKGLIKHLGFSIHDKASVLEETFINHPDMEFAQLQINYADWDNLMNESGKCYEVAKKYDKPIIIMEPIRGGNLSDPPPSVQALLREADPEASFASWALRFAASLDNVITVLSGMSDIEQMEDNLATMEYFKPLDAGEQAIIEKARDIISAIPEVPCTGCNYCLEGCPQGIAISLVMKAINRNLVYASFDLAKGNYQWATVNGAKGSECIACGRCEEICPQHISVMEELSKAAALFEK